MWLLKTLKFHMKNLEVYLKFKNPDCDVMNQLKMNHGTETIDSAQVWPSSLLLFLGLDNQNEDK